MDFLAFSKRYESQIQRSLYPPKTWTSTGMLLNPMTVVNQYLGYKILRIWKSPWSIYQESVQFHISLGQSGAMGIANVPSILILQNRQGRSFREEQAIWNCTNPTEHPLHQPEAEDNPIKFVVEPGSQEAHIWHPPAPGAFPGPRTPPSVGPIPLDPCASSWGCLSDNCPEL